MAGYNNLLADFKVGTGSGVPPLLSDFWFFLAARHLSKSYDNSYTWSENLTPLLLVLSFHNCNHGDAMWGDDDREIQIKYYRVWSEGRGTLPLPLSWSTAGILKRKTPKYISDKDTLTICSLALSIYGHTFHICCMIHQHGAGHSLEACSEQLHTLHDCYWRHQHHVGISCNKHGKWTFLTSFSQPSSAPLQKDLTAKWKVVSLSDSIKNSSP